MFYLRLLSLPLLRAGDRISNSQAVRLAAFIACLTGVYATSGVVRFFLAELTVVAFLMLAVGLVTRWQRRRGVQVLADDCCPRCGLRIGEVQSAEAFAGYTRFCVEVIKKTKGQEVWLNLGLPLTFDCCQCSAALFYDYLDSGLLWLRDEENEADATPEHVN